MARTNKMNVDKNILFIRETLAVMSEKMDNVEKSVEKMEDAERINAEKIQDLKLKGSIIALLIVTGGGASGYGLLRLVSSIIGR